MTAPIVWTMGRDQYGTAFHDLGAHPRKALLAKLGRSHAEREGGADSPETYLPRTVKVWVFATDTDGGIGVQAFATEELAQAAAREFMEGYFEGLPANLTYDELSERWHDQIELIDSYTIEPCDVVL